MIAMTAPFEFWSTGPIVHRQKLSSPLWLDKRLEDGLTLTIARLDRRHLIPQETSFPRQLLESVYVVKT